MEHTYDENKAGQALDLITKHYFQQLEKLHCFFSTKTNE